MYSEWRTLTDYFACWKLNLISTQTLPWQGKIQIHSFWDTQEKKGEKRSILAPNAELNEVLQAESKFHFPFSLANVYGHQGKEYCFQCITSCRCRVGAQYRLELFPNHHWKQGFCAIFKWNDFMRKWGFKQDFHACKTLRHDGNRLPQGAPTHHYLQTLCQELGSWLGPITRSRKLQ